MGGIIRGLLDSLHLSDDDESFADFERKENAKQARSAARSSSESQPQRRSSEPAPSRFTASSDTEPSQRRPAHTSSNYGTATYIENKNNSKSLRMERPEGSKVVPIRTTPAGYEVCVMKPRNFEDSQDICDVLLSNCVAIVNLEDNDLTVSQRIMDFISGAVYSINGKLFQISELIFIAAPDAVDVSGDYNDILAQSGYDVPLLNKSM